jgi:uncharacterized membrane protein YcaP (DUF421 family)
MGDALMEIVIRTAVVYIVLWLVIRGTGKRELATMGPFDLVLLIVVGDIVQQAVTQEDMSLTGAVIALATMALIVISVSALTRRSRRARALIEGQPTTVVKGGVPIDAALRRERLPMAELLEAARSKGIDDLASVRYAIVEPNGGFSFITDDGLSDEADSSGVHGGAATP